MSHPRTIQALTPAQQRALFARMQEPGLVDVSDLFVPIGRIFAGIGKIFGFGGTQVYSVELVDITAKRSRFTNYQVNIASDEAKINLELNGFSTMNNGISYTNGISEYSFYSARGSTGNSGMLYINSINKNRIKYDLIGE
jgi:hypothetical protein